MLPNPAQEKEISGKVWPDGSFGWRHHRRNLRASLGSTYVPEEVMVNVSVLSVFGLQALEALQHGRAVGETECLPDVSGESGEGDVHLGLSEVANYRKPSKAPRGARGITSFNRRAIRSIGSLLEMRYGKSRLSFATLTVPNFSPEDRIACQSYWCRAVQRLHEEMKRFFERKGCKYLYVGCTEIQPQRSEREGWAAPHLHFVFIGKEKRSWIITPLQLRKMWQRIWRGHLSGSYSWNSCENLVAVKKSVAGYLAKYLSKGGTSVSNNSLTASWFPSSWVSMPLTAKNWLRKTCVSVGSIFPIISETNHLRGLFSAFGCRTVKATTAHGHEIAVGVTGWIKASEWLEFLAAFWPEKLTFDPLNP